MINLIQKFQKSIVVYKILGITYSQLNIYFWSITLLSIIAIQLKFYPVFITCFYVINCLLYSCLRIYKNYKYQSIEYKMSILMPILNSPEFAEYQKTLLNQEEENN